MLTSFNNLVLDILKPKSCSSINKIYFSRPNLRISNNVNKKKTRFFLNSIKILFKELKLHPYKHHLYNSNDKHLLHKYKKKNKLVTAMSSMTSIPTMSKCIFCELLQNRIFFAGFFAWFLAQFIKIIVEYIKTGEFKLKVFFMSGGMPSSHSSTCMAVTTAIGLQQGLSSSLFAVSFCFTAIVMHDAAGIRRHAGYQAQILNAIKSGLPPDHPASEKNTLKEVLGHSRREVFAGCFVGILVGIFFPYLY